MDVHIAGVTPRAKDGVINITMTLSISNTGQIEKVLRSLRAFREWRMFTGLLFREIKAL
jgi:(p)ppGpp synthase/HD superfamily hydrolase